MIAVDTSTWSAFLAGHTDRDTQTLDAALVQGQVVIPPVVLTELLSSPRLAPADVATFTALPLLSIEDGFWQRAGRLRASVLRRGLKSRLADVLIAQCCIDHDVPLLTRDSDFRHYTQAGLHLL